MSEPKCTAYVVYSDDIAWTPCHCPACGGFLPARDKIVGCKRCNTELIELPDPPEDDNDFGDETGRICQIGKKGAWKRQAGDSE